MKKPGEDVPIAIASDLWASEGMAFCLRRNLVALESDIRSFGNDVDPGVRQYWIDYAEQLGKALVQVQTAQRAARNRAGDLATPSPGGSNG